MARPSVPLRPSERKTVLVAFDLLLTAAAGVLALSVWAVRDGSVSVGVFVAARLHWVLVLAGFWMLLLLLLDVYDLALAVDLRATFIALGRIALLETGGYLLLYFFSPRQALPRGVVLYHSAIAMLLLTAWRAAYTTMASRALRRRALIVGAGYAGCTIARAIAEAGGTGLELVGLVDDDATKQDGNIAGLPVLGTTHELAGLAKRLGVVQIILAITHDVPAALFRALLDCNEQGVEVVPMTLVFEEVTGKVPIDHVGGNWLVALPLGSASTGGLFPLAKRALDIAVALVGLAMLGVLFPFVALAIYLDSPGPIFYTQSRVGQSGRAFQLIKLRTMTPEAERDGKAIWAVRDDPRITRVGRVLRAAHIDELPQFINVMKGEMSVVGPRPERPEFVEKLVQDIPFYRLRHAVRPGMAGWALIKYGYGNSVEDARIKVQYDLYYVKHQSLHLDAFILLKTVQRMLSLEGRPSEG